MKLRKKYRSLVPKTRVDATKHVESKPSHLFSKIGIEPTYPIGIYSNDALRFIKDIKEALIKQYKIHDQWTILGLNIFVRGTSGTIFAGMLTAMMQGQIVINIFPVDKNNEYKHRSDSAYYYHYHNNNFDTTHPLMLDMILDDLISSGITVDTIWRYMRDRVGLTKIDILAVGTTGVVEWMGHDRSRLILQWPVKHLISDNDVFTRAKEVLRKHKELSEGYSV